MNRTIFPLVATVAGSVVFRIIWIFTVFPRARRGLGITQAYHILLISYPISWIVTFTVLFLYYLAAVRNIQAETEGRRGGTPP